MDSARRITSLDEIPDDTTFLFTIRHVKADEEREAILVRLADDVACWLNYCQHLTHIHLDKGSGAEMRNGELVCTNHGAYFESDSGYCNFGPCEGAFLNGVDVTLSGGEVYLSDDDYEFVGYGPIETDPIDRSSSSNVEF
ncbi:MAG: Rieske (2Fe-2S) protein [Halobacteriota archaeon]